MSLAHPGDTRQDRQQGRRPSRGLLRRRDDQLAELRRFVDVRRNDNHGSQVPQPCPSPPATNRGSAFDDDMQGPSLVPTTTSCGSARSWLARKDSNLRSPDPESSDVNRSSQPIFELNPASHAV